MISLSIFLGLSISSSLAIIFATPRQLAALRKAGIPFPLQNSTAIVQGIGLSIVGAGLGVVFRGTTGFTLLNTDRAILPAIVATTVGILGHFFLYYVVFRSRLPRENVLLGERIRLGMGLLGRVLQGGISEEVQFRWGLMSLTAGILLALFSSDSAYPFLAAIAVSAVLFALFHLVGARQIGVAQNRAEIGLILIDNAWAGIIFGWLFWQYGLLAAMASHALFHVVWFPIEQRVYERDGFES